MSSSKCDTLDPYKYDETEPLKCGAKDSCLWELSSLSSHYSSSTLKQITLFKKNLPRYEDDIAEYFDKDFQEVVDSKLKMNDGKDIPLNFIKEKEILKGLDGNIWTLE